jgi:hypothetical protein
MRRGAPINWARITTLICDDRADGRCECAGQCGGHPSRCPARHGHLDEVGDWTKLFPVPLDGVPFHVEPRNLLAMCVPCRRRFEAPPKAREEPEGLFDVEVQDQGGLLL